MIIVSLSQFPSITNFFLQLKKIKTEFVGNKYHSAKESSLLTKTKREPLFSVRSFTNSSLDQIQAEYALRKNKMNLTETEWSKLLLEPYRYNWIVLPNDYCTERYPHIKILIVVYTAPENFKARAALRFMYKDKFYSEVEFFSQFICRFQNLYFNRNVRIFQFLCCSLVS